MFDTSAREPVRRATSAPATLAAGGSYNLSGKQLNGLTEGAAYGDDYQDATNYPLVRITSTVTGAVSYACTSGMTKMSVARGLKSSVHSPCRRGSRPGRARWRWSRTASLPPRSM